MNDHVNFAEKQYIFYAKMKLCIDSKNHATKYLLFIIAIQAHLLE